MHTYIYTHIHAYIHAYTYTCTYTHTYTHTHRYINTHINAHIGISRKGGIAITASTTVILDSKKRTLLIQSTDLTQPGHTHDLEVKADITEMLNRWKANIEEHIQYQRQVEV